MEGNDKYLVDVNQIACIYVLFYPEHSIVNQLMLMADEGYLTIVVINGIDPDLKELINTTNNLLIIDNGANLGLAVALNQGINAALAIPIINYVILFDQDSVAESQLPINLASELSLLGEDKFACIAPHLVDVKRPNANYESNVSLTEKLTTSVPTSGTVITRFSYNLVGPMLEPLFIDCIDHEWCFRARYLGLDLAQSRFSKMLHNMGDDGFQFFGVYKPIHRSPIRHYYIIRNSIYLLKISWVPKSWKIKEMFKIGRRIIFYCIFSSSHMQTFKLILKAILDGHNSRLGPLLK